MLMRRLHLLSGPYGKEATKDIDIGVSLLTVLQSILMINCCYLVAIIVSCRSGLQTLINQ